jgi:hypothetical protein
MKSMPRVCPGLTSNLVMEIFDVPITFHRSLVRVTGSVTAALMLSQAIAWTETLAFDAQGWFAKSQGEWYEDTGLSRWEQETARRILRQAGFIEEQKLGVPAKLWFRVRKDRIGQALHDLSRRTEHARHAPAPLP